MRDGLGDETEEWPPLWATKGARVRVSAFNDTGYVSEYEGTVLGYEFRGRPMIVVSDGQHRHDIYRDQLLKLESR